MLNFKKLVSNVLTNGEEYTTNKGVCVGVIGAQVEYDISETLPVITGKKTNVLWAVAEYTMFLKGLSHLDVLKKYGAEKIWEGQSLSEDTFLPKQFKTVPELTEELANAKGVTVEEAKQEVLDVMKEYFDARGKLDQEHDKLISESPSCEHETITNDFIAKIKDLDDIASKPYSDAGIDLYKTPIDKTKGDLGPIYGTQWRSWKSDRAGVVIDQIKTVCNRLINNPGSRQQLVTSWNPSVVAPESYSYDEKISNGYAGQPPCHVNYHFLTRINSAGERVLHTTVWMRSNDLMLGHGFNAVGSAVFAHLIANKCGFKVGKLVFQISDAHIYKNHVEKAKEYLHDTKIYPAPSFKLPKEIDVDNFTVEDIMAAIGPYESGPYMQFKLNVNDNEMDGEIK